MPIPMRWVSGLVVVIASGLLPAALGAAPLVTLTAGCMEDVWHLENQQDLACTANDIELLALSALVVEDACDTHGDFATVQLRAQVQCLPDFRYDVGLYLALDGGSALTGSCASSILATGDGPLFDVDGDACGEMVQGEIEVDLPAITLPCIDADFDGLLDLSYCSTWRQSDTEELCTTPADAFPGAPSKCHCARIGVTSLPVPDSLELRTLSNPPSDPGRFDLLVDSEVVAESVGHLGSSGALPLAPGSVTVGILGGSATTLSDYATGIVCLDNVGRCSGDPELRCFAQSTICNEQAAGFCDSTPTLVTGCTTCTSVEVEMPDAPSAIVCTITNSRIAAEQIVVAVETTPPGELQLFDFTTSYDGDGFSLGHGEQESSGELAPGTYSVSEALPEGWRLENAICSDGSEPSAIGLDELEGVTCVFHNVKLEIFVDGFDSVEGACAWSTTSGGPSC